MFVLKNMNISLSKFTILAQYSRFFLDLLSQNLLFSGILGLHLIRLSVRGHLNKSSCV